MEFIEVVSCVNCGDFVVSGSGVYLSNDEIACKDACMNEYLSELNEERDMGFAMDCAEYKLGRRGE
jgi:hypothetical protein